MEPGQHGVTGLLDGDEMFIKPEGFDELHNRGGGSTACAPTQTNGSRWGLGQGKKLSVDGGKWEVDGKIYFPASHFALLTTSGGSMHYRRLGRSGLKVSEISLGAWITFGSQIEEADRHRPDPRCL